MFGQIFGNPGSLNKILYNGAGWGAKNFYRVIEASFAQEEEIENYSLIKRIQNIQSEFTSQNSGANFSEKEYKDMSTCILLEVMTSFHILTGSSFGYILEVLLQEDYSLENFVQDLKTAHEKDEAENSTTNTDYLINKVLSKKSTTEMVYRIARQSFPKYNIKAGDHVCFRIREASKYINPDKEKWLTFGPHEKCPYTLSESGERKYPSDSTQKALHPCFGQFWARSILKTMFLELFDELPDIKIINKNIKEVGIPLSVIAKTRGK